MNFTERLQKVSTFLMFVEKRLVLSVIFGHLSTFYQLEFKFGDRKFFARGTFPRIHTEGEFYT